jgi:RecB family endonuclease NucS
MVDDNGEFSTGERPAEAKASPSAAPEILSALERDLEEFLVNNLELIEPGLRLYEQDGREGRQFEVGGGRIDLLCEHPGGDIVVVELKACEAADAALGQVLGYVGLVSKRMFWGRKVRGILIAPSFSERTRHAAALVGLSLLKCRTKYSLEAL